MISQHIVSYGFQPLRIPNTYVYLSFVHVYEHTLFTTPAHAHLKSHRARATLVATLIITHLIRMHGNTHQRHALSNRIESHFPTLLLLGMAIHVLGNVTIDDICTCVVG